MSRRPAFSASPRSRRAGGRVALLIAARSLVWFLLIATITSALTGCSGCYEDPQAAKKREEEEEKKKKTKGKQKDLPNFEVNKLVTFPHDPEDTQNHVKPGHWVTLSQHARANHSDYRGELELTTVDKDSEPFDVDRTPYQVVSSRPANLVKGQSRFFEMTAYVPTAARADIQRGGRKKVYFQSRLLAARSGSPLVDSPREGTNEMKEYENYLLVLARDPRTYLFLKTIDSTRLPTNDFDVQALTHYRVILPKVEDRVPLPENPLTWTTIAYIIWDEVNPKLLSPDQERALLDWLHWGGQLILSGPDTLDLLKGSFLEPYLAARSGETNELDEASFRELNEFWSLADKKQDPRRIKFVPGQPVIGSKWQRHEEARDVPGTGGLVVERRLGAGRVVQTSFSLDDRPLLQWKSYDGFFNGAILRRPARDFEPLKEIENGEAKPLWVMPDDPFGPDSQVADGRVMKFAPTEPRVNSTLRYFSRDIGYRNTSVERSVKLDLDKLTSAAGTGEAPLVPRNPATANSSPATAESNAEEADRSRTSRDDDADDGLLQPAAALAARPDARDARFGGYSASNLSGVAGWNDFSGAAHDVRLAIQEAAGIKIPSGQFVLKMIGIYLVVLVPLNWLVFWLMGKVEWAWVATPVIAIVGAVTVIQQAQLDIGFLRSRRELAILEAQGDYDRAHLTRYSLLYTYLGTAYDAALADPNALAQPFAKNPTYVRGVYDRPRIVQFRRDAELSLRNFFVPSYSSEMVHIEQMLPLGGAFRLEGDGPDDWELHNGTSLTLHGAGVVYCPEDGPPGQVRMAWIGDVKPGIRTPLRFVGERTQWDQERLFAQWDESPITGPASTRQQGELRLTGLMTLASQKLLLFPGDARLVGWTDEELAGVEFSPTAAQTTTRTVVLAHLRRGKLPTVLRDLNVRTDFKSPTATEDEPMPDPNAKVELPSATLPKPQ